MSKIISPDQPQIIVNPGGELKLKNERILNAIQFAAHNFSDMLTSITGTRVDVCLTAMIVGRGEATTHATCPAPVTIKALEQTLDHLKKRQRPVLTPESERDPDKRN